LSLEDEEKTHNREKTETTYGLVNSVLEKGLTKMGYSKFVRRKEDDEEGNSPK